MKTIILSISTLLVLFSNVNISQAQTRSLSLSEALNIVEQGNKEIQVQVLEEMNSKEITQERKNGFLPTISANIGYSYFFDKAVIFLPGSFMNSDKAVADLAVGGNHTYNGYLSLYQPVYSPSTRRLTQASKVNEKMQSKITSELKSRLALQISKRYFDIQMMKKQQLLLEQSRERNLIALKDARSLFLQNKGLRADTLRSYIAVENIESSLSTLKNNIGVSYIEFKRLIGIENSEEIELTDKLDSDLDLLNPEYQKIDDVSVIAQENRNDLEVQKLAIELQQKNLSVSKAEYLPQLSFIGQYQVQAQSDDMKFRDYNWPRTSFIGLQLSIPIFNGNRTRSKVKQAKLKIQQEETRLEDLKANVRTELATIISKWDDAVRQLKIQDKTVESAEVNYKMMNDRFKNALSSRLELTDAELALTQAKINHLYAIYNLRVLKVELKHAMGLLSM